MAVKESSFGPSKCQMELLAVEAIDKYAKEMFLFNMLQKHRWESRSVTRKIKTRSTSEQSLVKSTLL